MRTLHLLLIACSAGAALAASSSTSSESWTTCIDTHCPGGMECFAKDVITRADYDSNLWQTNVDYVVDMTNKVPCLLGHMECLCSTGSACVDDHDEWPIDDAVCKVITESGSGSDSDSNDSGSDSDSNDSGSDSDSEDTTDEASFLACLEEVSPGSNACLSTVVAEPAFDAVQWQSSVDYVMTIVSTTPCMLSAMQDFCASECPGDHDFWTIDKDVCVRMGVTSFPPTAAPQTLAPTAAPTSPVVDHGEEFLQCVATTCEGSMECFEAEAQSGGLDTELWGSNADYVMGVIGRVPCLAAAAECLCASSCLDVASDEKWPAGASVCEQITTTAEPTDPCAAACPGKSEISWPADLDSEKMGEDFEYTLETINAVAGAKDFVACACEASDLCIDFGDAPVFVRVCDVLSEEDEPEEEEEPKQLSMAVVAGAVAGGVFGALCVAGAVVYMRWGRRPQKAAPQQQEEKAVEMEQRV